MIVVIRISGLVEIPQRVEDTLFRMRLRKKYGAVLMNEGEETNALLQKVRNFVAYGSIDKETLTLLVQKRAKGFENKKVDLTKVLPELGKKSLIDLGLKPFFALHPPRGGIDSKIHFGKKKGVLGDNKEKINDLVRKML